MWPWNASTVGEVYILHFSAPIGNAANARALAGHYIGFTDDLDARLAKHRAGTGSKLVAAAVAKGITFEVFHWPAPLATEKLIKRYKKTSAFCPACAAAAGRKARPLPTPPAVTQLSLDLEDFPEIEIGRMGWAEIQATAAARRYFVKQPTEADLLAIDDLI
jgi:hypothetical protein